MLLDSRAIDVFRKPRCFIIRQRWSYFGASGGFGPGFALHSLGLLTAPGRCVGQLLRVIVVLDAWGPTLIGTCSHSLRNLRMSHLSNRGMVADEGRSVVLAIWGCGILGPMSASDLEFRWTLGVSLLAHAAAFGVAWISAAMQVVVPQSVPRERDVWIGTTVSVVEVQREPQVSPRPESGSRSDQSVTAAQLGEPRKVALEHVAVVDTRKMRASVPAPKNGEIHQPGPTEEPPGGDSTPVPRGTPVGTAAETAPIDLKQAMQNSLSQPANESGTFGAAGVDLTERRLPKALTRALPVAIGAEPRFRA